MSQVEECLADHFLHSHCLEDDRFTQSVEGNIHICDIEVEKRGPNRPLALLRLA